MSLLTRFHQCLADDRHASPQGVTLIALSERAVFFANTPQFWYFDRISKLISPIIILTHSPSLLA